MAAKRRRISNGVGLFDLPTEALSHVAGYLPRPSRAMFAITMNDDELSSVILGLSGAPQNREQYDILDFGEVEGSLASKITDDILQDILIRIDAYAKLRRLKLAGCVNITGTGLDTLRGSIILEQIDLSLVAKLRVLC